MNKISIVFLQSVILLGGLIALFVLIRFPLTEGRAVNLDLFSIYADPFILYGYASSIAFFVGLYGVFQLLGNIGRGQLFSQNSIKKLKRIKYCAIILSISIVMAGLYIVLLGPEDEDSAGFVSLTIILTFISIAVATTVAVFEKILQNAIDMKSENDLTI